MAHNELLPEQKLYALVYIFCTVTQNMLKEVQQERNRADAVPDNWQTIFEYLYDESKARPVIDLLKKVRLNQLETETNQSTGKEEIKFFPSSIGSYPAFCVHAKQSSAQSIPGDLQSVAFSDRPSSNFELRSNVLKKALNEQYRTDPTLTVYETLNGECLSYRNFFQYMVSGLVTPMIPRFFLGDDDKANWTESHRHLYILLEDFVKLQLEIPKFVSGDWLVLQEKIKEQVAILSAEIGEDNDLCTQLNHLTDFKISASEKSQYSVKEGDSFNPYSVCQGPFDQFFESFLIYLQEFRRSKNWVLSTSTLFAKTSPAPVISVNNINPQMLFQITKDLCANRPEIQCFVIAGSSIVDIRELRDEAQLKRSNRLDIAIEKIDLQTSFRVLVKISFYLQPCENYRKNDCVFTPTLEGLLETLNFLKMVGGGTCQNPINLSVLRNSTFQGTFGQKHGFFSSRLTMCEVASLFCQENGLRCQGGMSLPLSDKIKQRIKQELRDYFTPQRDRFGSLIMKSTSGQSTCRRDVLSESDNSHSTGFYSAQVPSI